MNRPVNFEKLLVALLALSLAFLGGCDNFMTSTEDFKAKLKEEVEVANAESVTVTVRAANDNIGLTSPLGATTVKIGVPFNILTTVNSDYTFVRWSQTGGEGTEVTFADATKMETTATISSAVTGISIVPLFDRRPYVVTWTPYSGTTGVITNKNIILTFNEPITDMAEQLGIDKFIQVTTIYTSDLGSSVEATHIEDHFTVTTTGNSLVLALKSPYLHEIFSTISVTLTTGVTDIAGNNMVEDFSWFFATGSGSDTEPPRLTGFKTSTDVAIDASDYTYARSTSISLKITALDELQDTSQLEITETPWTTNAKTGSLQSGGATLASGYVPFTTPFSYVLKSLTSGSLVDGWKRIQIKVGDPSNNYSSLTLEDSTNTMYVCLDRIAPTVIVGAPSVAGNAGYVRNGQTLTIPFAMTEAVSGLNGAPVVKIGGQTATVTGTYPNFSASYDFAGTTVTQGLIAYSIDAVDNAGNVMVQKTGSTGILYDRDNPTVGLTKDHPDMIVTSGNTVRIYATFNETVFSSKITIGSVITNTAMAGSGTNWYYDWIVPAGNDGSQIVSISATDAAGNANSVATGDYSYTIDNIKPTVSAGTIEVTDANSGYAIQGSVITIPLTITEASSGVVTKPTVTIRNLAGVSRATMTISALSGSGPNYTCDATYTMQGADFEEALYYQITAAVDGAGNTMLPMANTDMSRTYDRTLPTATFAYLGSSGSPGAIYTVNGIPALHSDAADTNGVRVQFSYDGGGTWLPATPGALVSGTTTVDLTNAGGAEGTRTVQVKVWDAAGNHKAAILSDDIIYDKTKPTVSAGTIEVTDANSGYAIPGSVITIPLLITEASSGIVTKPTVTINNSFGTVRRTMTVSGLIGSGPTYTCDATYIMVAGDVEEDMYYQITAAVDGAGNTMLPMANTDMSRTYDKTKPTVGITPLSGSYINADTAMVIDAGGGTLTAKLDGYSTVAYTSGTTKVSTLDATVWSAIAENGDVPVTVYSTDPAGNVGYATSTFMKDTVAPSFSAAPVYVIKNLTVTLNSDISGIVAFEYLDNREDTPTNWLTPSTATFTGTTPLVTANTLPNINSVGEYFFYRVKDGAGNYSIVKKVFFTTLIEYASRINTSVVNKPTTSRYTSAAKGPSVASASLYAPSSYITQSPLKGGVAKKEVTSPVTTYQQMRSVSSDATLTTESTALSPAALHAQAVARARSSITERTPQQQPQTVKSAPAPEKPVSTPAESAENSGNGANAAPATSSSSTSGVTPASAPATSAPAAPDSPQSPRSPAAPRSLPVERFMPFCMPRRSKEEEEE